MENKQTAVEWLESELDWLSNYMMDEHKEQLFNQAKEMERMQIINAFQSGVYVGVTGIDRDAEDYYNITYGK